jgi:hypothetical protein
MRDVGKQLEELQKALRHPLQEVIKIAGLSRGIIRRIAVTPSVSVRSQELAEEAVRLGAMTHRFGNAVIRLLARHREEIVEEQMVLDRVATIAITLFTTAAVLSRLDAGLERDPGAMDRELAIGRLYCREAFRTADAAFARLFRNDDAAIAAVSDALTGLA